MLLIETFDGYEAISVLINELAAVSNFGRFLFEAFFSNHSKISIRSLLELSKHSELRPGLRQTENWTDRSDASVSGSSSKSFSWSFSGSVSECLAVRLSSGSSARAIVYHPQLVIGLFQASKTIPLLVKKSDCHFACQLLRISTALHVLMAVAHLVAYHAIRLSVAIRHR